MMRTPKEDMGMPKIFTHIFIGNSQNIDHIWYKKMGIQIPYFFKFV